MVKCYNLGMGGIDRFDHLMAFYRISTKSSKWYKRVLYHFIDLSLINSFILYKLDKEMPLFRYKLDVALALMYGERFGEPLSRSALVLGSQNPQVAENGDLVAGPDPPDAVRFDGMGHFPSNVAKRGRLCKLKSCQADRKLRSTFWCQKCRVYLCLKKDRNCFLVYHTAP